MNIDAAMRILLFKANKNVEKCFRAKIPNTKKKKNPQYSIPKKSLILSVTGKLLKIL